MLVRPAARCIYGTIFLACVFTFLLAQRADARIDVTPPPFVLNVDLDLSLAIGGTPIMSGDTLATTTSGLFPVTIAAVAKPSGTADWSPADALSGSEGSQTYADAFYLDFYKGTLFSDATFISGEEMNADGPLKNNSAVTLPGPGTYSAVLYDSGQIRDPALCTDSAPCATPRQTLDQMRARIEKGQDLWDYPPRAFLGIVTFTITDDPCATPGSCVSNVLFLPGIEGSRLYEGTGCGKSSEEKLWEPIGESITRILLGAGDDKVRDLSLDSSGESACSDIYVKEGDILDSAGGDAIYASLIHEMNEMKASGAMSDWEPAVYDWRLSLDDILQKGAERDGKIFYNEATSTPYIEQTLRALARNSKTGKVTIIAHSNGGLVAKALLSQLGGETAKSLVDKIIMVGVPQTGAPMSIGALLFGYDQGISSHSISILHTDVARAFAENSPMAYHLLPSEDYLESIAPDVAHRVARFAGDAYQKEISAYGATIGNRADLRDFLLAKEGGREKPRAADVNSAEIVNSTLIDYGISTHASLDFWRPPEGIEVDQIAGWGVDTVAGIDFYTPPPSALLQALALLAPTRAYRPMFTEDGDGTVPTPSALMLPETGNVKRYWVNLDKFNREQSVSRTHRDLFEIPSVRDFIQNILQSNTATLPTYVSSTQPAPLTATKKLTFFLHSPLTLQIEDASGHVTGIAPDDSITEDIPGSTYGEFGEVKYITVPEGQYQLTLHGQANGIFSLDVESASGITTFANFPTTASTLASLTISGDTLSPLTVDEHGDSTDVLSVSPRVGDVVNYEPPAPAPAPQAQRGGGAGSIAIFPPTTAPLTEVRLIAPTTFATTSPIASATKQEVKIKVTNKVLVSPKRASVMAPQTASVYTASQQSVVKRVGEAVYNGLHGFWSALKKLF